MGRLRSRIAGNLRTGRGLFKAGVTLRSVLLFAIRRRLSRPRNLIELTNGVSITSPVGEPLLTLFKEIWIDRCYVPSSFDVGAGDTVVDIGANVGVFTLWAASRHEDVKVIAVEPSPRMCEFLRQNISVSKLRNVTVVQSALGGQTEEATLYSRGPEVLNSLYCHDATAPGDAFFPLARTEVLMLDEIFDRFSVKTCNFLKLDCEGAEYEILFNARQSTLERIVKISMEYHIGFNDHAPEELTCFLTANGFRVEKLPMNHDGAGYLYAVRYT